MEVLVVGLNHRSAPVEIRERLAFSEEETEAILPNLRLRCGAEETLLLSTCNRTEALAVFPSRRGITAQGVWETLRGFRTGEPLSLERFGYEHRGEKGVRHLLRLAGGLDSMVLGEPQVFGQLKSAYSTACRAGTNGIHRHIRKRGDRE